MLSKNSVFATARSLGALAEMIASSAPSNRLHGGRWLRKSVDPNRSVTRRLYYQACLGPLMRFDFELGSVPVSKDAQTRGSRKTEETKLRPGLEIPGM